ncbi:MAG: enoyl-CoA hydratase/isomerase family protein [Phycisphaerales bacterium]|nr:enoyl-CoA hydratase/isomerase family protein [Phycisphaerales bacterium]
MIEVKTEDSVTVISLDRGEKRNAMLPGMLTEFESAVRGIGEDSKAVVVNGKGKVFCAGFDLKACAADESGDTMRALLTGLSKCIVAMRECSVPVVMGVHGCAIAGGCAMLGGADVVVCERGAKLGYPVVKIGVSPAVSAAFLMSAVPHGAGRALMLDPGLIDGSRAFELGLVHEVVEDAGAVDSRVMELAGSLAAKPGVGVRETKRLVNAITKGTSDLGGDGLEASLSRVGSDEERAMLGAVWGS